MYSCRHMSSFFIKFYKILKKFLCVLNLVGATVCLSKIVMCGERSDIRFVMLFIRIPCKSPTDKHITTGYFCLEVSNKASQALRPFSDLLCIPL
jgi:hypothetical protein